MLLPETFTAKMKRLLNDEFHAFMNSYEEPKTHGLRVNTLKVPVADFLRSSPFHLERIPWAESGFYFVPEERPGKHPYHEAGLYYIQEPSAMAAGELAAPKPGERVLDLCAAPGGKTTHLAAKMKQEGLLIANEIHPARAKVLSQNVERMGIRNAVVTNENPGRMAERFSGFFDRILVDAPCSGEGMFRKDPEACEQWRLDNVARCAVRQLDILKDAAVMLKPGGRLVYSTCTFSPEENEGVVDAFLKHEPVFEIEDIHPYEGFDCGRRTWIPEGEESLDKTIRLWPHRLKGEGHFFAVMRKKDGDLPKKHSKTRERDLNKKQLQDFLHFGAENLTEIPQGDFISFGGQLYMLPKGLPSLQHLKVMRPGWHLGTLKKNRFEPAHAFALSLKREQVNHSLNFTSDSDDIKSYLRGESLKAEGRKGWYLVNVDGYSIGWGKLAGGLLKNHFPKGLRWIH